MSTALSRLPLLSNLASGRLNHGPAPHAQACQCGLSICSFGRGVGDASLEKVEDLRPPGVDCLAEAGRLGEVGVGAPVVEANSRWATSPASATARSADLKVGARLSSSAATAARRRPGRSSPKTYRSAAAAPARTGAAAPPASHRRSRTPQSRPHNQKVHTILTGEQYPQDAGAAGAVHHFGRYWVLASGEPHAHRAASA